MAEQRERSRASISRDDQRAVEFAHAAGFRTEFVGYEKTDVLTQLGALEQLEDGLFLAKLRESPFYPAGGGQVTDAGWIELDGDPSTRAELRDAYGLEEDQVLLLEGGEFSEGDRMLLSYAMCNHDPASFPNPDEIVLDRLPNPHAAFGLGVHRCIGSNLARLGFKHMLRELLRRMPDYRIEQTGKVQYDSIGVINGYKHLPATFTPGRREGPPLADVMEAWQATLDAEPAPENLREV